MTSVGLQLAAVALVLSAGPCGAGQPPADAANHAAAATHAGAARRYADMTDAEVSANISRAHSVAPFGQRLQAVSDPFLGTPYVLGNMGEGPDGDGRDKDPRYNVKSADCTTFVEHTLAFALAADLGEARSLLDRIRYDHGLVGYGTRRHWPEAQWVPGLIAEGFLEDATAQIAGNDVPVERESIHLSRPALLASAHEELKEKLKATEVPAGDFAVPYIPLGSVLRVASRLEPGLVINIVKAEKRGVLTRISHQGLIAVKDGQVYVRNASSVGKKAVVDEKLEEFVARQAAAKTWPTVGFNFLRARERVVAPVAIDAGAATNLPASALRRPTRAGPEGTRLKPEGSAAANEEKEEGHAVSPPPPPPSP